MVGMKRYNKEYCHNVGKLHKSGYCKILELYKCKKCGYWSEEK